MDHNQNDGGANALFDLAYHVPANDLEGHAGGADNEFDSCPSQTVIHRNAKRYPNPNDENYHQPSQEDLIALKSNLFGA